MVKFETGSQDYRDIKVIRGSDNADMLKMLSAVLAITSAEEFVETEPSGVSLMIPRSAGVGM